MTLYELLRKVVTEERFWNDEKADALALIERMENLNAFGSTALYTVEHECIPGEHHMVPINSPPSAYRGYSYSPQKYRQVVNCTICGKEMQ